MTRRVQPMLLRSIARRRIRVLNALLPANVQTGFAQTTRALTAFRILIAMLVAQRLPIAIPRRTSVRYAWMELLGNVLLGRTVQMEHVFLAVRPMQTAILQILCATNRQKRANNALLLIRHYAWIQIRCATQLLERVLAVLTQVIVRLPQAHATFRIASV